ncbi:hypothetical protein NDU88_003142 [Pleurodeles waltl]|uniref:Uncharacterized protein n=1 Tax=Pleurodeles waltl TaxID=8319 RepID=A0AAV7TN82_PLEWA|nr:hypothetical protein NDU88_003142 [Pleurodeles waltl]
MSDDAKLQAALRLLAEAGRLDILRKGVGASSGLAAALLACSPLRTVPMNATTKEDKREKKKETKGENEKEEKYQRR